jgi:hypothetical protein
MKKLYTTPEYKAYHKRRLLNIEKKLRKAHLAELRAKRKGKPKAKKKHQHQAHDIKLPVIAPSDLRLIENTNKCLAFFRDLRSEEFRSKRGNIQFVILSLKEVTQIDYGTISILTAIGDDLKFKGVILRSFLPDNPHCKEYMIESGYLNNLYDDNGKPFPKAPKSELMFFEKGCGRLSDDESRKISLLIKKIVGHLTGVEKYCQPLRTIILEICGNSIEWSGTDNKQWLLGVKYRDDRVIFTVTDVGKGILESLYRRLTRRFFEAFKSNDEILKGAFDKKYGSTTKEENRNKGLPAVKANFNQGTINNLKVLTNNVILHFDNDTLSKVFENGTPRFKGTFYQWEMTNDCLKKLISAK